MAIYFQGYFDNNFWKGLEKRGFLDYDVGLKFHNCWRIKKDKKFNEFAAKGGELYNLLAETRLPFYLDRVVGGVPVEDYPYSKELVEEYTNLLGDSFYGFQIHEWASNHRTDWDLAESIVPQDQWTEEGIIEAFHKANPVIIPPSIDVATLIPRFLANQRIPRTISEFLTSATRVFNYYSNYSNGRTVLVDSYFMAPKIAMTRDLRLIMPEVGCQIPNTRVQYAYTRGVANAYNYPWGVYYESYGGSPFSCPCYQRDGLTEWGKHIKDHSYPANDNGGSSRSLQERLHVSAYMGGARFFADEWGTCNTFYDWNDFEISPYGMVKLNFLKFMKSLPDPGVPFVPIAVVLPADMPLFDLYGLMAADDEGCKSFCRYPVTETSKIKTLKNLYSTLRSIFGDSRPFYDTDRREDGILVNSDIPDVVDMIHADDVAALSKYRWLIDLTGDPSFAASHSNIIRVDQIRRLTEPLLPCNVEGSLHCQFNQRENDWLVAIYNHNGVRRTMEKGEWLEHEFDDAVKLTPAKGMQVEKLFGNGELTAQNNSIYAQIPAGGWIIIRLY